jgi:hypothetical protein
MERKSPRTRSQDQSGSSRVNIYNHHVPLPFHNLFSVSLVWLMCLCLCLLDICYVLCVHDSGFLFYFYGFQSLWIFSNFWKFCSNFTLRNQKLPIDFVAPVQKLTAKVFMFVEHVNWRQTDESSTICVCIAWGLNQCWLVKEKMVSYQQVSEGIILKLSWNWIQIWVL